MKHHHKIVGREWSKTFAPRLEGLRPFHPYKMIAVFQSLKASRWDVGLSVRALQWQAFG